MAMFNNKGDFVSTHAMPTDMGGDGYGYDIAINPSKNALLTRASRDTPTTCATSAKW